MTSTQTLILLREDSIVLKSQEQKHNTQAFLTSKGWNCRRLRILEHAQMVEHKTLTL